MRQSISADDPFDGHYARQCCKPHRQCKGEANFAQGEEPTLLVAHVMWVSLAGEAALDRTSGLHEVHLTKKKANSMELGEGGEEDNTDEWFLDTGATNHMTGAHSAFAKPDTGVVGKVKFGDGSLVEIRGRGTVLVRTVIIARWRRYTIYQCCARTSSASAGLMRVAMTPTFDTASSRYVIRANYCSPR